MAEYYSSAFTPLSSRTHLGRVCVSAAAIAPRSTGERLRVRGLLPASVTPHDLSESLELPAGPWGTARRTAQRAHPTVNKLSSAPPSSSCASTCVFRCIHSSPAARADRTRLIFIRSPRVTPAQRQRRWAWTPAVPGPVAQAPGSVAVLVSPGVATHTNRARSSSRGPEVADVSRRAAPHPSPRCLCQVSVERKATKNLESTTPQEESSGNVKYRLPSPFKNS